MKMFWSQGDYKVAYQAPYCASWSGHTHKCTQTHIFVSNRVLTTAGGDILPALELMRERAVFAYAHMVHP